MGFTTPTNRPQSSELKSKSLVNSELSQEEWISSFLLNGALRARLRSLPVFWMIIVSVVVFPIGLWSQMDSVSVADESEISAQSPSDSKAEGSAKNQAKIQEVPQIFVATIGQTTIAGAKNSPAITRTTTPAANSVADQSTRDLPVLPNPNLDARKNSVAGDGARKVSVSILVSGRTFNREVSVPASGATVRHAIEAMNLKIDQFDRVFPVATSPIYSGAKIRITRIRAEVKKRTVAIESNTRFRPSAAMRPGEQKIENAGQTGLTEISERVWFKDGQVSSREALGQKIVRAAEDKVIAVGARPYYMPGKIPYHNRYAKAYTLAARAGSPRDRVQSNESKSLRPVRSIILTATGYSPDPSENGGYTVTATGLPISYGAAAVDPRVIPLGTKMYVEGYGYAFACDTGGAIKGNRIDLAYDSYGVANSKGRKKVRVWILAP